jgi:hypothetical protein
MLNLLSPALFTNHRGQSKADAPSPAIWSRIKGEAVSPDGTEAMVGIISNFQAYGIDATGTSSNDLGGFLVQTVGTGSDAEAQADGSGLRLTTALTTATAAITSGGNVGGIGQLSLSKACAFESRVTLTESGANGLNMACGVSEPAVTHANKVIDEKGSPDSDFVGFIVAADSTIKFAYQTNHANQTLVSGVSQAITSGTAYKLGFVIDPNSAEERLRIYIDGVQVKSVSKATLDGDAHWPDDINFAATVGTRASDAADNTVKVGFCHCIQVG